MMSKLPEAVLPTRRKAVSLCVLSSLLLLGSAAWALGPSPPAAAGNPLPAPQNEEYHWLGPDLEVVPLTDEEIVEFLQTAPIVESEFIDIGINGIHRLTLEQGDVRLRAGFREVDIEKRDTRVGDEQFLLFRDSSHFECAAYALARLLGIENVPPAAPRNVDGVDGSVQLWVENTFDDLSEVHPPNARAWAQQTWMMKFFDSLIYNVDRNPGNLMVDRDYHLWLIDHTRAFQRRSSPYRIDEVEHVRADVWERLQNLTEEDFQAAFAGLLESIEIKYFLDRRAALIEHLDKLIAERNEFAVLY